MGLRSKIVDGNDVVAVYETTKTAVDECRAGRGPVLIEVKTMRMKGHAQHDPAEYVPKAMFDYWKTQDPIARYEAYLDGTQALGRKRKNPKSTRASSANWTRIRNLRKNRPCRRPNSRNRASIATAATRSKPNGAGRRKK